jgi:XTP/dITP diphosphohydrolase
VDALGGAPGVISAHFAPTPVVQGDREALRRAQDAANNALLLQRLQGQASRRAAFVSTLVAVRHAHDPEPLVACGRWVGQVLDTARGAGGFGYDPLMFIAELGATVAELPADVKNRHSHRALAAAQMRQRLSEAWSLG